MLLRWLIEIEIEHQNGEENQSMQNISTEWETHPTLMQRKYTVAHTVGIILFSHTILSLPHLNALVITSYKVKRFHHVSQLLRSFRKTVKA